MTLEEKIEFTKSLPRQSKWYWEVWEKIEKQMDREDEQKEKKREKRERDEEREEGERQRDKMLKGAWRLGF